MIFNHTQRFHRQPIGFGPASSPRQNRDGERFDWNESEAHLTGAVFETGHDELQALLPEGYQVDRNRPAVICFENTLGIYASNIICTRSKPAMTASYQLVLFESFCDAIITGREELGFGKVWADLPDPVVEEGRWTHTAAWLGNEFICLQIPNVVEKSVAESPAMRKRPYTMRSFFLLNVRCTLMSPVPNMTLTPSVEGFFHHRYVPAVGIPGQHDASYAVYMPGTGDKEPRIKRYCTTSDPLTNVSLDLKSLSWEELPTLYYIVKGLASIPLKDCLEVYIEERTASDCAGARRIE